MRHPLPLPGPYGSRNNLPDSFRTIPFVLTRDHLYPVNQDLVQWGIDDYFRAPFRPFAFLPWKVGPFSRPVGGVSAVYAARAQLVALQAASAQTGGHMNTDGWRVPPPIYVPFEARPLPGYGVQDLPETLETMPPDLPVARETLQQAPWTINTQTGEVVAREQVVPPSLWAALRRNYLFNPLGF